MDQGSKSSASLSVKVLGKSGIAVTSFGMGCGWVGELTDPEKTRGDGDRAAIEAVGAAVASGVRYFDAAPLYQGGDCERRVGVAMQSLPDADREGIVISTKAGREPSGMGRFDAASILQSVQRSLEFLQRDFIHILFLHDPRTDEDMDQILGLDGAIDGLEKLKQSGTIGAIGLGVKTHRYLRRAIQSGRFDLILTPYDYTPVRASAMAIIDLAVEHHMGVVNASPYSAGLLAGIDPTVAAKRRAADPRDLRRAQAIWKWCGERGLDVGVMAMQFSLRNPKITTTITGPRTAHELMENVRHATTPVSDDCWTQFQSFLGSLESAAPGGESD